MSKIVEFEKNNGNHWIIDDGYKLKLFVDEKRLAQNIVNAVFVDANSINGLNVAFFSFAKSVDVSQKLIAKKFSCLSDKRLDGWNGLFSYRAADRVRMIPVLIPHGDNKAVQEKWLSLQKLHKQLMKDDVEQLASDLADWRNE